MTRLAGGGRDGAKSGSKLAQGLIPDWVDAIFLRSLIPAIRRLVAARVDPNWLTVMAFVLTVLGAVFIVVDRFMLAFASVVAGGILDFLDGKVAVLTGRVTRAGAVLDSTLDRYSDIVVYLALLIYYASRSHPATALAAVLALVGSMMTSYMMALGKSHGIDFRVGILRRQDRVTLISVGLLFTPAHGAIESALTGGAALVGVSLGSVPLMPLAAVVYLLAVLSNVTALQRVGLLLRTADVGPRDSERRDDVEPSLRTKQLAMLEHAIGAPDPGADE
jgi:CDP-diacylglycerol--glycerol-3-phosphate 3-phosphatidyltransferase